MKNNQDKKLNPYSVDKLAMVPQPVKAIFIKWWFAGAVFFFVGMGIPALHKADNLDLIAALGIVLGMVNDLLVNNIFRYMRTDHNDYDKWMVFPKRSLISFFLNIVYYLIVSFVVYAIYSSINMFAVSVGLRADGELLIAVEPVGYGIFVLFVDLIVLFVKYIFKKIFLKGKKG